MRGKLKGLLCALRCQKDRRVHCNNVQPIGRHWSQTLTLYSLRQSIRLNAFFQQHDTGFKKLIQSQITKFRNEMSERERKNKFPCYNNQAFKDITVPLPLRNTWLDEEGCRIRIKDFKHLTKKDLTDYFYIVMGSVIFMGLMLVRQYVDYGPIFTVNAAKPILHDSYCENPFSTQTDTDGGGKKPPSRREIYNFISDVVEAVGQTVVCIQVKDHTIIDWFNGTPQTVSNGSGFIIDEDGLILTNAHVVMGCPKKSSITVRLYDGRCLVGHVEDVDLESDLATIRVNAEGLPTMPLGCSSETRIGEWVVALGSPLQLSNSVTAGIVSSISRKANDLGITKNNIAYIQTDAAITFGNSGGPLVNLDGEAIGVNSMKVTSGISFAIPIDYVKDFLVKSLDAKRSGNRKPVRRYIGATLITISEDLVAELFKRGLLSKDVSGVLVWKVVVGGPAYMAGLQPGDILTKINDDQIHTAGDLYTAMHMSATLKVHVRRLNKNFVCYLTPENLVE